MATKKVKEKETSIPRPEKPSQDPDGREKQLMSLAYDLAEKQLRDGTASAAVISHFLKRSTKRESLEQEILAEQKTLIVAKAESLNKDRASEVLMKDAMEAMTKYRSSDKQ